MAAGRRLKGSCDGSAQARIVKQQGQVGAQRPAFGQFVQQPQQERGQRLAVDLLFDGLF